MKPSFLSLFLLLKALHSSGALYESSDSLPTSDYDFIVAGGGTAGNVIANRLTENPNWRVLVIESGPSNEGVIESIVPSFYTQLGSTKYDWNYTTVPQPGLNGRTVNYTRGHMLGGSSSINGMFYTRGSSSDFDRYANVTGDKGWSWGSLQPYFRKNERWTAPVDDHNTTGQFDPSVHGFDGINAVSLVGYPQSFDSRLIQTTKELPEEFPFNLDWNSGNPLGLGYLQMTVNRGKRSSSATSYLAPQFLNRSNLDVLVNTYVTRVIQTGTANDSDIPEFRAIELASNFTAPRRLLNATKEIILSSGVIGTPQILLNSGIGEASELEAIGVEPVLQLHDVGKNFTDQPSIITTWLVNASDTLDDIARNPELQAKYFEQWQTNQTGPFSTGGGSHIIWGRLPDNSTIFETIPDPAAGNNTPHWEIYFINGGLAPAEEGHWLTALCVTVSPDTASRGNITLQSSNPFDHPLVDPGFLTSEYDKFALRECVRKSFRFLSAPVWKDYVIRPDLGLENVNITSDEELDKYILQGASATLHGVGTASMSSKDAGHGVVDPDLRVKGASGLRVVDASVMPYVPASHTQAPVYVIAERAADLIKEFWSSDN